MTRFLSSLAALSIIAVPANGQVPPGIGELLALLPPACLELVQQNVIPCFTQNPECFEELPTADDFSNLPAFSDIMTCDDISDAACPILSNCEPCLEDLGALVTCVLAEAEGIPQETADFVNSCVIDCEEGLTGGLNITANATDVPVAAPVAAPTAPSSPVAGAAPTAPVGVSATLAPSAMTPPETVPPSAASRGAVSLAVVGVAFAMSSVLFA